jgi:hypothetical protein
MTYSVLLLCEGGDFQHFTVIQAQTPAFAKGLLYAVFFHSFETFYPLIFLIFDFRFESIYFSIQLFANFTFITQCSPLY